jgi:glycosyltransferase involved in cell wall biosynthesis
MKANGTSLGADNGIGLSMALAILADDSLPHPPLEVLTTTNEEDGMSGASHLSPTFIRGRKVINLDSEAYDETTVASAGAIIQESHLLISRVAMPKDYVAYTISVSGGKGGHSGVDINKGRANAIKVLANLLLVAIRQCDIKLYIVGAADNPIVKEELNRNIEQFGIQDRVKYFDFVSQEEKIKLYADCRGVVFIPKDEDYGYITLEAMSSSKPVITAKDSGGPLEFVLDRETGFVCEPNEESIAEAMDALAGDQKRAIDMGNNGKARIDAMGISWDNVVKELLSNANQ